MSAFEIVTYKKHENRWKALYIGKQKDITRKVYNVCFIIYKNYKAKNAKTRVYREVSYISKCRNSGTTLLIEKQNNLTKCVYFECFSYP